MSWLFSQALVEAYSEGSSSAGEPSAPSNLTHTPQAYLSPDRMTAFSRLSRFGMTYAPLTDDHGADVLTLFLAAFPAREFRRPELASDSTTREAGCGLKWHESLARWDRATYSWKTPQCSLLGDSDEYSGPWPRWGIMRDGVCWALGMSERLISETASGLWATIRSSDAERGGRGDLIQAVRGNQNKHFATPTSTANQLAPSMSKHPGCRAIYPTPHGFSKDGKSNGPSGNELGRAVNKMMWPTPNVAGGGNPPSLLIPKGNHFVRRSGKKAHLSLDQAVKMFPTPTSSMMTMEDLEQARYAGNDPKRPAYLPTPTAQDAKNSTLPISLRDRDSLPGHLIREGESGGSLNPTWVEWLMGWPLGWTDLKPLETDKFRRWSLSHGGFSDNETDV